MGAKLAAHFNCPPDRLGLRLDNHLIRVDLSYQPALNPEAKVKFDWWGTGRTAASKVRMLKLFMIGRQRNKYDRMRWKGTDRCIPGCVHRKIRHRIPFFLE